MSNENPSGNKPTDSSTDSSTDDEHEPTTDRPSGGVVMSHHRLSEKFGGGGDDVAPDTHNPDGVEIPFSGHIEAWDRRIETQVFGDSRLKLSGPEKQHEDSEPHIRISAPIEDDEYDDCGGHFRVSLSLEDAEILASTLDVLRQGDPFVTFPEIEDADEADGGGDSA